MRHGDIPWARGMRTPNPGLRTPIMVTETGPSPKISMLFLERYNFVFHALRLESLWQKRYA